MSAALRYIPVMRNMTGILKPVVTALFVGLGVPLAVAAQEVEVDALLEQLSDPETQNWQALERQIRAEWSKSGSAAMDFLLERGREALEEEDVDVAIEHLTALTDHAPDFAEGWNARATAFFQKGRYGPALADIRRALALNPRHFEALTGLAVILQRLGYEEDALSAWRAVETIHPHRPQLKDAIETLEKETGGTAL